MPFVSLWAAALTRVLLLGVVADSFGTRDGAVSNRPVSLGLNSPSVLPWGRPVEPRIATRTFWGMWHVTSSLLNGRSTGTAPATSPLGRPSLPGPILGDRACVRGSILNPDSPCASLSSGGSYGDRTTRQNTHQSFPHPGAQNPSRARLAPRFPILFPRAPGATPGVIPGRLSPPISLSL